MSLLDRFAIELDRQVAEEWPSWPAWTQASIEGLRTELHSHARDDGVDFSSPAVRRAWVLASLASPPERRLLLWITGAGTVPK